jgi:hypothetical protein
VMSSGWSRYYKAPPRPPKIEEVVNAMITISSNFDLF